MDLTADSCYRAVQARDARFDGLFFTGVITTGIYCRCICPARLPKRENCRFFAYHGQAESSGFRPCMVCRPELAPGRSPLNDSSSRARKAAHLIEQGLPEGGGFKALSSTLSLSDRQLRRIVVQEFGVTPSQLAKTHKLLQAKHLLTDTRLPVGEIALLCGFRSVRAFNANFQLAYSLCPSELRRGKPARPHSITTQLAFRPPFAWAEHLDFLAGRQIDGVEMVGEGSYARTVLLGRHQGTVRVSMGPNNALQLEISATLAPVLPAIVRRIRHQFDLNASPCSIASVLGDLAADCIGLRLPGAFEGFEAAVRAILGQQVSVSFATSLAGRVARKFGSPVESGIEGLRFCFPDAARLAGASLDEVASCGIVGSRARAIIALANEVAEQRLLLTPLADFDEVRRTLLRLPGIGPWTAEYIGMRALGYPDAFPSMDLGVLKALQVETSKAAIAAVERYRPWRSYAVMHLWRSLRKSQESQ